MNLELSNKKLEIIYADGTERYDQIIAEIEEKKPSLERKEQFIHIAMTVSALVVVFMLTYIIFYSAMNEPLPRRIIVYTLLIASAVSFLTFCQFNNKYYEMIDQLQISNKIQDSYVFMNANFIIRLTLYRVEYENKNHEICKYELKEPLTKIKKTDIDHYILDLNKSILYVPYSIS